LYKGYVARRNEIALKLSEVERVGNVTYTPYRALKIAETFARNGQLLHELYFEELEGLPCAMGERFKQALTSDFGSVESFLSDLKAAALASRGWVITAYDLSDKKIHNYVADAHNETIPVNVVPLFITDVYEHAYFLDFGTDRSAYLDKFFSQVNWQVVEDRMLLMHP
jgi:Fe-Mn family superoxide dismutase